MKYESLSDKQKKEMLQEQYEKRFKSFADISKEYNTYSNKLRRDAIKFNIKIRTKSEAQANALKTGKSKHPTKGKERRSEVKEKIGMSVLKSWENLDENSLRKRKEDSKIRWEKMDNLKKEEILKQANAAVRLSSKNGSKLEKYILKELLSIGLRVEFHKEQTLSNTKLQLDLFLPEIGVVIEVDGPSHFEPVWGDEALKKNKKYDNKKNGLIIGKGLFLIRVQQKKDFSPSRAKLICENIKKAIANIENIKDKTTITIGDNDAS